MPLAASTGLLQPSSLRRETQMPTSGARSRVPPNQAATNPVFVRAIVDAWHEGNGAVTKINSVFKIAGESPSVVRVVGEALGTSSSCARAADARSSKHVSTTLPRRAAPITASTRGLLMYSSISAGLISTALEHHRPEQAS